MDPAGRYRLTFAIDGSTVMAGWWEKVGNAEGKFAAWKRDHDGIAGARITLVDTETGETLTSWP
jgi:hypothetical protein